MGPHAPSVFEIIPYRIFVLIIFSNALYLLRLFSKNYIHSYLFLDQIMIDIVQYHSTMRSHDGER